MVLHEPAALRSLSGDRYRIDRKHVQDGQEPRSFGERTVGNSRRVPGLLRAVEAGKLLDRAGSLQPLAEALVQPAGLILGHRDYAAPDGVRIELDPTSHVPNGKVRKSRSTSVRQASSGQHNMVIVGHSYDLSVAMQSLCKYNCICMNKRLGDLKSYGDPTDRTCIKAGQL